MYANKPIRLGQLHSSRVPAKGPSFVDYGHIAGVVKIENTPARRRVRCLDRKTGQMVAETWSADDGSYRFDGLMPGLLYQIIAMDYERQYNAVIADSVDAAPGSLEPKGIEPFPTLLMPFLVGETEVLAGVSRESVSVVIPEGVMAGDAIVLWGLRREEITYPAGWNYAGDQPITDQYPQWTYGLWKIADGTEGGTTVTVENPPGVSSSLTGAILVVRSATGSIGVNVEALNRPPKGEHDTTPLEVQGAAYPSLLFVAFSWAYSISSTDGAYFISKPDGAYFIGEDPQGNQRNAGFIVPTDNGSASLSYTHNVNNSEDTRADVWFSFVSL